MRREESQKYSIHAEENNSNETIPRKTQVLNLLDKKFISAIINTFQELK